MLFFKEKFDVWKIESRLQSFSSHLTLLLSKHLESKLTNLRVVIENVVRSCSQKGVRFY